MTQMADFEIITTALAFPEGPIALGDGSILLVEIKRGTLTRVAPDGKCDVVAELGGGPNGAAIGPDGAVYVCNNGGFAWFEQDGLNFPAGRSPDYRTGSIQRVDLETGAAAVLYDSCDGEPLRGPNDIVFDASGGFWFTDHGHGNPTAREHGRVFYAAYDGSRIVERKGEMIGPNGIGLSPDGSTLYVSETYTSRLWAMAISSPGELASSPSPWQPGRFVAAMPSYSLFDSLAVEAGGSVCVATLVEGGIAIIGEDGAIGHLRLPDIGVTNICFGGADMRDAWITGSTTGTLFKLRWPRPGLELAFEA